MKYLQYDKYICCHFKPYKMAESLELDKIDVSILTHLKNDGRKSFTDIADEMNTSVGTIRNRYNKLVDNNVLHIIGWIDPVNAGYNAYARVNINVKPTTLKNKVADRLLDIPEASFVALTAGDQDIEVNLTCKTNKDLIHLMDEVIHKIEGVYDTNTTVYLKVLKWASHNISKPLFTEKLKTI